MAKGKHRAIDPNEPFKHKDLKGETRPSKIKEMLDKAAEDNQDAMDKIIKDERGGGKK